MIRSLTTLAIGDTRRPKFWRDELITALTILQRGDIAPERMTGSWAGAMGHTQFMPSSYVRLAVDYDRDGRRDIWASVSDALASTGNYLKASGWRPGQPATIQVTVGAGFDFALASPGTNFGSAQWRERGIAALPESAWPPTLGTDLSLILPAGANGPAFLVTANFRAILKYNNAVSYALAVAHLADRIAGKGALEGQWPTHDPPLKREQREELQRLIAAHGLAVGPIDGMLGAQSRAGIRAMQKRLSLPEDGWAGERLLEKIKSGLPRQN